MQHSRKPIVDLSDCILCGVCVDVAPMVFQMNSSGYIEVIDLDVYPEEPVNEAVRNCPGRCIAWEP